MSDIVENGNAVFLRPKKVGSSIRYKFSVGGYGSKAWTEGEVNLTDCDRRICWRDENEDLCEKIEVAIKALLEAKEYALIARKELAKRKKMKAPK